MAVLHTKLRPFLRVTVPSREGNMTVQDGEYDLIGYILQVLLTKVVTTYVRSIFLYPHLIFVLLRPGGGEGHGGLQ